ncbi:MAG: M4 family metallopeptidase [Saprospiraceae bacterium]
MKTLQLALLFLTAATLSAQQSASLELHRFSSDALRFTLEAKADKKTSGSDFFKVHAAELGLGNQTEMKSVKVESDGTGTRHFRYQQYVDGLEVMGAVYLLHEKNGEVVNGNGMLMTNRVIEDSEIDQLKALTIADQQLRKYSSKYKIISSKKVIVNTQYPDNTGDFVPAYVFVVHSQNGDEDTRKLIVDARYGTIIRDFSIRMNCFSDKGRIQTLYHGERDIDADAGKNNFLSINGGRGKGIFVTNKSGKYYSDDDNFWQAGSGDYNNGMHDLFWGLQKTYDFYNEKLQRKGADNADLPIKAFLLDTEAYVNAFWSPQLLTLNFGIGDFDKYKPLTSIDVVGHEFTHGVTQFTAGLEYLYEAGAMNEAFSDIMGKSIEYEFDRDSFNWYIGARFSKTRALAFRSMEDPNLYNNPKFYKGKRWATGTGDNGGVHTNSGVLNHWFYLLCTGVKDTNELNYIYDVKRLGFDTMTRFAYTLLSNYLGVASNYYDAREASLLLATNWWGVCSLEYNNIIEAWRAVGVGGSSSDRDMTLINSKTILNSCKDGYYTVECRINNQGCNVPIPAGTEIKMYYKFDTAAQVQEVLTLDKDIPGGTHVDYVFKSVPRIVKSGQSRLTVWMESGIDADTSNNRYSVLLNRLTNSVDHDFRLNNLTVVGAPCPNVNNEYTANANTLYNGCTVIPPNNDFELRFIFKDSTYVHRFKNQTSVYPGFNMPVNNIKVPRSFIGLKKVLLNLVWIKDTLTSNNMVNTQLVMIDNRIENVIEKFSGGYYDSTRIQVNKDSFNVTFIQEDATLQSEAVVVTGGKILNNNGTLIPTVRTDQNQMFNSNTKFTTKIYVCADASHIVNPRIEFDLAYKKGAFKFDSVGIPFSSALRMNWYDQNNTLLRTIFYSAGDQSMQTEHVAEALSPEVSYIDLTILCLQGSEDPTLGMIDYTGDVMAIDNVVVSGTTGVQDAGDNTAILLFPNPVKDELHIVAVKEAIREVKIYDMIGREILNQNWPAGVLRHEISALPSGQYMVICQTVNGQRSRTKVAVIK